MFVLRQIIEKCSEFGTDSHVLFTNFRHGYESINRHILLEILKEFEFLSKLIKLVKMTLLNSNGRVKIQGNVAYLKILNV